MTWEVASFLIVGAVILAGFAWYERSRPPAQVVALVAALAALAIAGRIAFAAFPNVKPTTDIIVFAGYALGGAPGFAVGALTALVSNFWFGQGPWTPWQMAGWGLCGVLGAVLSLGVRNAGRVTLAATCAFAGIAYGALMNFSLMATYGGDLSLRHFLVLEARAIPFEIAHVLGNVVLALVAGPAMVRMLVRFRERFEWERQASGAPSGLRPSLRGSGIAALLLGVLVLGAVAPSPAHGSDLSRGADWLEAQQRPSGGFAVDDGREAGAEMTGWAMLGLAAVGRNPLDVTRDGKSPVDFLRSHIDEVRDPGDVARTILALEATGLDPRDFAGQDLVERMLSERRQNGSYQGWPGTSAYAVLALRAAGANEAAAPTVEWLRKVQSKEGGWGNLPQSPSTAEITGAVLQVLTPESEAADRALAYLRKEKRPNGGFAPGNNLSANAQATAWVSQGLLSAGKDPTSFGDGKSSLAYLRSLQVDDGHFLQAPGLDASPVWVTSYALVPLSSNHLPIAAPPREPKQKPPVPNGSASSGGVTPSLSGIAPATPGSGAGDAAALQEALESTGAGSAPGGSTVPGGSSPGALPSIPPAGGRPPEADLGSGAPEASALQYGEQTSQGTDDDDEDSSAAGAVILGLVAGAVLFAIGLGGRRGWMRWRYGV
jgi:energy-coupling factor transport system substrate-specific component